jgi:hypothetical protein
MVGFRTGLKGKVSVTGFIEPSVVKLGNTLSATGSLTADFSAELHAGRSFGIKSSAELGVSTDGLVMSEPEDLFSPVGGGGGF